MGSFGAFELIIILGVVVMIFGVGRLPEVGSALGKGIREFKSATGELGPEPIAAAETNVAPAEAQVVSEAERIRADEV